jgi:serine/threonine protein kinase/tetratricopeptide (TPR) repeat protein
VGSSGPFPTDPNPTTLPRGATVSRYVILGLVGRGGMGEVYAAYDPELDRKVALKLLRVKPNAGVTMSEGRARTLREAQAIARLSHPNVVVVYDVGTFRDQVFIAMEFVEGNTASYWVESQNRSWQEILKIFVSAGRGLMAAHEKGLVHRDFKPDNVMVGKDGTVRVMDFGLARQSEKPANGGRVSTPARGTPAVQVSRNPTPRPGVPVAIAEHSALPVDGDPMSTVVLNNGGGRTDPEVAGSAVFDVRLTRTGAMMGTPAYMAPEQFLGTATDTRTDQFAFCISLYEALFGERPFAGNTMFALTSNVVQGNMRDPPGNSKVPFWVRKILLRGLRPHADERWPSMLELIEALGKNPAAKRKRWAAAAVAALAVAGMLGVGRASWENQKAVCTGGPAKLAGIWELRGPGEDESPRQAQIHKAFQATGKGYAEQVFGTVSKALNGYVQSWANMHRETCEATQVRREQSNDIMDLRMECLKERLGGLKALTDAFAEASGDVVENAVGAANALGSLDRCADVPLLRAVVRPPEDASTRARVEEIRGREEVLKARYGSGRIKEAMQSAPVLVAEAQKLGYQPLIAETLALLGFVSQKSDDTAAAERAYLDAYFAAEASRHDEVRAGIATELVFVVGYEQGRYQDAKRWARIADAVLNRLGGHQLLRSWLLNDIGAVYYAEGDQAAAAKYTEQALGLKEKVLGVDHPDVAVTEGNLAIALAELGRSQEALVHIQRSVTVLEHGLGEAHPETAFQLGNYGEILNALGRPAEARRVFERARITWEREVGPESRSLAYPLTGIGLSYLAESNPGNALAPLERAFTIRKSQETNPAKRAETAYALARALWESNRDKARARTLADEARSDYQRARAKAKVVEVEKWLQAHEPG